jgi:glycosyltransferase involved in cell wall biosynthesis
LPSSKPFGLLYKVLPIIHFILYELAFIRRQRTMHIAHISTSVTLNQTVFNQMVYQQKKGHQVVALCPDDEWTRPIKYRDIPVIHVPFLWHDAKASLTSALLRTFQICRQKKFDVVHTHTLLPGIAGRVAARLAGVPCVVHTFHSWQPHLYKSLAFRGAFYATEIFASHFAHAILFQNPDDLNSWSRIPGIPIQKGTLVGNGIDFSAIAKKVSSDAREKIRKEFGISDDTFVVAYVARFEPQKGHFFLLQTLKHLIQQVDRKVVALLVGIGVDQPKIEAETERLNLQDVVYFTGYRQDVPDILTASDVSIMTSHYEGIPRALMESMALGIPVVATDVPGTRTLIRSDKTGLLVDYGDVPGLSEALIRVLTDPALAKRLGANGRVLVQTKFNEYTVADRVEEIYKHILKDKYSPLPQWELDAG